MGTDKWRTGRGWGRRLAIGFALLLAGAAVLFLTSAWSATSRFDAKVQSYRDRGEPILPEDFVQPKVPDDRNAALVYTGAIDAMKVAMAGEAGVKFERDFTGDFPLEDTQRELAREAVAACGEPLRLLRAARGMPEMSWDMRFVNPVSQTFMSGTNQKHFNSMRPMANLLRAAALDAFDRGDHAAGVEYLLDIVALARAVDRMPPTLTTHLIASGIDAVAAETALDVAPDLRADAAKPTRELIIALFEDAPRREGLARAWQGERMICADTVRTLSQSSAFGGMLFKLDGVRLLEQADRVAQAASQATLPAARAMFPAPPPPGGVGRITRPLSYGMWPSLNHALESEARSTVQRRAAATALAIRLYALDHDGALPPTLLKLPPQYLPTIPTDPFSAGNSLLGYVRVGDAPKVYSVGLNGVDDGGSETPVPLLGRAAKTRWETFDFVFHLTRQPQATTQEAE